MKNTKIRSLFTDLADLTSQQPDKIALLDDHGRSFTYRNLLDQVERAHAWLASIGIHPGDTLMALMPNAIETVILILASLRAGCTYAPLPCTATIAEVGRWKKLTHARFCFFAHPVSASLQEQIKEMDWQARCIDIGGNIVWPIHKRVDVVGGGRIVMASSGSTGEPKAMLLDADRLWSGGKAFLHYHKIEKANIRFWNYLPMSYLGGLFNLTLIPLAAGGSVFISEAFNGKTFLVFWATVERFKINSLWLVPTILRGLLSLSDRIGQTTTIPHIERCYLGTAPVSLEEKQRFSQVFGIEPLESYGLSETTFISSERLQEIALRQQGSVGTIMPNVEVKLASLMDEEKLITEICVRTPYMMLGYLNSQGLIELSIDAEGFLHTGDCGQIVDGQLQLSGRRRDIIKKGGILIALREIELVAELHSSVAEATAVRVEHSFYGESCVLYVRSHKSIVNHENFVSDITVWLHEQLARNKWPERILYCKDFPRTASGKIQKHLLSAESAANA